MKKHKKGWWILIPFVIAGFIALAGYVVMSLWNWLMPEIFGLTVISFWQAIGLLLLSKILFGGFHGKKHCPGRQKHHWRHKFKEKWSNMSEEDKLRWKEKCESWGKTKAKNESEIND